MKMEYRNEAAADITIKTETGEKIPAHSLVLSAASPVVAAMVTTSNMQESKSKVVAANASKAAVLLMLEVAYCGSAGSDKHLEVETIVGALDLGHRWQIQTVVNLMEALLVPRISEEHFDVLCEAAELKSLVFLTQSLREYARTSKKIRERFFTNKLPNAAMALVQKVLVVESARKRRRTA